jgi:Fe-S cluster assembly protein SufD
MTAAVQRIRDDARRRFADSGFPTTREEEWRFTNVAPIVRASFADAPFKQSVRVPAAVQTGILADAEPFLSTSHTPFVTLNTANLDQAIVLRVPRHTVIAEPIFIDYEGISDAAVHPRAVILVGANSQCTIVETYSGRGRYFTNAVTDIVAEDNAIVDHYKVQQESPEAFHIATLQATLGRSTNFSSHSISLGGALVRNDAGAVLSEGTEATLNGLYLVNGTQHIDNHTVIDHAKPNAMSHEMYKGILDGRSSAVFNGRIIVRKDAQKTDSKQTNKNLVLSDESVINTKPELQIWADDVRCTHGATIGQLDAESLFYLQSRGIGKTDARNLLTYAFAQDIVNRIKVQSLRDGLEKMLFGKFHEHAN